MAILDSKFDILRGWPNGSAVSEELKLAATAAVNPQTAGKWVPLAAGMVVEDAAATSTGGVGCALIIEGREDESHKLSNTCTVLLGGGYVVRLENKAADNEMFTAAGLVPGAPVAVAGSIIVLAEGEAIAADVAINAGAEVPARNVDAPLGKVVGFVLDTNLAQGGATGTIDVYIR